MKAWINQRVTIDTLTFDIDVPDEIQKKIKDTMGKILKEMYFYYDDTGEPNMKVYYQPNIISVGDKIMVLPKAIT